MTVSPVLGHCDEAPEHLLDIMAKRDLRHIPIVNDDGQIMDLVLRDALLMPTARPNWVVLMAGGLGTRLRPITESIPKPLVRIGGKPILQMILESLVEHHFVKFFISVNYRSEMIKTHFGDGSDWGVTIRYLEEQEQLGTAGSLGLLEERPSHPLVVMNGDLLTRVNYSNLLDFHIEQRADATMCVREYDFEVPFGVVTVNENRIEKIVEKPVHSFFVNAGIYVINPIVLDLVRRQKRVDMPDLFQAASRQGLSTVAFPVREYWLDIGRVDDLGRAHGAVAGHVQQD
jgi:NDP-sugar pyrophosphorylase family protein